MNHTIRQSHIQSLREKLPAAQQAGADDSHWTTQLVSPSMELICTIHIVLPPSFPAEKPQFTVQMAKDGLCSHPWVTDNVVVGHSGLNQWERLNHAEKDLGVLARNILGEFAARPPNLILRSVTTALPPIPDRFPELDILTDEEIKWYHEHPDDLGDKMLELEVVQRFVKMRDELVESNKKLAQTTKEELAPKLIEAQKSVQNKYNHHMERRQEVEKLMEKENEITRKLQPASLVHQVREVAFKMQQEADAYVTSVLDKDVQFDKKTYLKQRTEYHRLVALQEKLTQMCAA